MEYTPPLGGAANDTYVDANPGAAIEGSAVPAAAIEDPQREIVDAITQAGLVPSAADLTQLAAAIIKLVENNGNKFTAQQVIELASTVPAILRSTAAGAGAGPLLQLHRKTTGATGNVLGGLAFLADSDTDVQREVCRIAAQFLDATNGSEDTQIRFEAMVAGARAVQWFMGDAIYAVGVTGGKPAAGAINAKDFEIDGVSLKENIAKAWVHFDGTGTVAIQDSFNVTSITDNGVGDYTVNLTNAMANANYCVTGSHGLRGGFDIQGLATGSFGCNTPDGAGTLVDTVEICAVVHGDQ